MKKGRNERCFLGSSFGAEVQEWLRWVARGRGTLHLLLEPQLAHVLYYLLESARTRHLKRGPAHSVGFALLMVIISTVVGSKVYPVSKKRISRIFDHSLGYPYFRLQLHSPTFVNGVFFITASIAHEASHCSKGRIETS